MQTFAVKIVEQPEINIAGLHVRTDMKNAQLDCPKLWHEDFGPRMCEIAPCGASESYGISWLVDQPTCSFDYWAAMPFPHSKTAPEGMSKATLPAGLYAMCEIDCLQKLPEAYQYIYGTWLPNQNIYTCSAGLPSYELYPADYLQTEKFFIYFAVIKK